MLQDHVGYLWFGAQRGLARYDGYAFTVFRHRRTDPASLVNDTVNVLYEDRRGRLWIGTVSGLDHYDAQSGTFIHHPEIYESVRAFAEDAEGTIWIGTAGSGLFRYDSDGVFTRFLPGQVFASLLDNGQPPAIGGERREVTVLFADPDDNIIIACAVEGRVDYLVTYHS